MVLMHLSMIILVVTVLMWSKVTVVNHIKFMKGQDRRREVSIEISLVRCLCDGCLSYDVVQVIS